MTPVDLVVGSEVTVDVGPIAHGGHCVARHDGRVIFVRHSLPGESALVRITEVAKNFLRGDAVEIFTASNDRVAPPCEFAGPAMCGGCDFQHVSPEAQRTLLGDVVREQLRRLAGIQWDGMVESVVPDDLGWRTRMQFAVDDAGRAGLRAHRSHAIVPVTTCRIAHADLPPVLDRGWDADSVEAIVSSTGQRLLVTDASIDDQTEASVDGVVASDGTVRGGQADLTERVRDVEFEVRGSGFWQVHPQAAATLVAAVMEAAELRPGERVADLYAGVGLFTHFLAEAVGPSGAVLSVEADPDAKGAAERNVGEFDHVTLLPMTVEKAIRAGEFAPGVDVVVLDPPRSGAKRIIEPMASWGARRLVYVACDPAALARDAASLQARGYTLTALRAFDLFPMTQHVECVAVFDRSP